MRSPASTRTACEIAKLNIDENPQTPPKFGIRGIPTLILFKNGTVEAQKVGAVSKSQLVGLPGQQPVRGYLGNQGRNRPNNKGPRQRHGGNRDGNRDGNRGNGGGRTDDMMHGAGAVRRRRRRDHQSRPS